MYVAYIPSSSLHARQPMLQLKWTQNMYIWYRAPLYASICRMAPWVTSSIMEASKAWLRISHSTQLLGQLPSVVGQASTRHTLRKVFLVLVLDCLLYYAFALDKLPIGYAKWLSASLKASKSTGGRFLHVFNYEVGPGFCMKLGMRPPLKSEPNTYMCLTQFFILSVWLNSYIYEHQRVES